MKTKYKITDIKYDTDGEEIKSLPLNIEVEIDETDKDLGEIEEELSDAISNITGFCHDGFRYIKS
jgi:hypothetical protein